MGLDRAHFTTGVELIMQDLNRLIGLTEKNLNDHVLYELFQRQQNIFLGDSFRCVRTAATTLDVKAGMGFFYESSPTNTYDPNQQYLYLEADDELTFSPDATHPRIDVICVKPTYVDGDTENRRTKSSEFASIVEETRVIAKEWIAEINVVEGTADPTPSAPATPAGYIKIAEVTVDPATVITNQAAIDDQRNVLAKLHLDFAEEDTPGDIGNPLSGKRRLWVDDSGTVYLRDSAGSDTPVGSGGGGGGSAIWRLGTVSPLEDTENNEQVFLFADTTGQTIHLGVKVPEGYIPGRQIQLICGAYTPSANGAFTFDSTSTLIRPGTDAVSSTTNQETDSVDIADAGSANTLNKMTFDLTDSSGEINSVAVSAGDLVLVELTRDASDGNDTDTADVRFLPAMSEVKLS